MKRIISQNLPLFPEGSIFNCPVKFKIIIIQLLIVIAQHVCILTVNKVIARKILSSFL